MIFLILKITLQTLAVVIAMLVNVLNYVIPNKTSTRFKTGRRWLFILSGCFLIASIVLTIMDGINNENKEKALKRELDKVQLQNDGLQKAVSVLAEDQRSRFGSLLKEQERVGTQTVTEIKGAANLLRDRVENSIALLNKSAKGIDRAVNPIRNIMIDVDLTTKLGTAHGEVYRTRIEKAISNLSKQKDGLQEIGLVYYGGLTRHEDLRINITKAPYPPDKNNEHAVYCALNYVFFTVDFYKKSVPVKTLISGDSTPEWRLYVAGSADNTIPAYNSPLQSVNLSYKLKDRLFIITGHNLAPVFQQSTGEIVAVPDLPGSWMVVRVGGGFVGTDNPDTNSGIKEIYKSIRIADLTIKMSEGREIHIKGDDLRGYTDQNNEILYIYQIPSGSSARILSPGHIE